MAGLSIGNPPTELALARWQPPAGCRHIEFFSDVHLKADEPRTAQALAAYLSHSDADAIVVLGDLFEAWVGDDARHEGFDAHWLALLSVAARQRPMALMVGNRDFLLGDAFLHDAGIAPLPDATVAEAFGQRILLSHGDAWCLDDREYLAFRRRVRDAAWQAAFLATPLAERRATAARMRAASESRKHDAGFEGYADVDADAARAGLRAAGASVLLHGHTHRPGTQDLGAGLARWVLSDWSFDGAGPPRGDVLRWDRSGLSRWLVGADGRLTAATTASA